MSMGSEDFKVSSNKKISLKDYDSGWIPKWAKEQEEKEGKKAVKEQALAILEANRQKLVEMQELFWASHTYSMLIILQGMDAAGKDSTISHVLSGVNPQGCQVTAFKTPSEEELDHDFLWRNVKALPEKGSIGIFNRSYYEDVLIVKVRPEVLEKEKLPSDVEGKQFWKQRYEDINMFERHLVRSGTMVLKFFLHVSKQQQKQRFLKRLEDPEKKLEIFAQRIFLNAQNGQIIWMHTKTSLIRQALNGHHGILFLRTRNGSPTHQSPRLWCRKSRN